MIQEKLNSKANEHTDLTFFTNEEGQTLLDRFRRTLKDTRLFDVLVGYFRSNGFYQLYESIESIEKTRILIGLGVDETTYHAVHATNGYMNGVSNGMVNGIANGNEYAVQSVLDFDSHLEDRT